jgi:ribulose-phosphate 3-epimerase
MSRTVLVAPSILSADFACLADEAHLMEKAGADWLHVDVMDGHFVPNITIGPVVVKSLKKHTLLPLDVHLMITDPLKYAEPFAKAGAWGLTFHLESTPNPADVIATIAKLGVKPAASIKPKTPALEIFPYLKDLHHVLIMTVEPGFGGQAFMADMLPKIREISGYIKTHNLACQIEVDGGIDAITGADCVKAGADVLVAGNFVFTAKDPMTAVQSLKRLAVIS